MPTFQFTSPIPSCLFDLWKNQERLYCVNLSGISIPTAIRGREAIIVDGSQDALEWCWSWVQFAFSSRTPNPQDGALKQLRLYRHNIAGSFLRLKPYAKVDRSKLCAKLLRTATHCGSASSLCHSVPGSKVRSCLEMSSALGESTNWSFLPSSACSRVAARFQRAVFYQAGGGPSARSLRSSY